MSSGSTAYKQALADAVFTRRAVLCGEAAPAGKEPIRADAYVVRVTRGPQGRRARRLRSTPEGIELDERPFEGPTAAESP